METDEKKEVKNGGESESESLSSDVSGDEECEKVEERVMNGVVDEESEMLLAPRKGGISRKKGNKTRRKVQWNDRNGDKLVEVLEYEPSEVSDSDDEDVDTCICCIM